MVLVLRKNCNKDCQNAFIVIFFELSLSVLALTQVNTCVSPTASCDCFDEMGKKIINCRYRNLTVIPNFTNTNQVYDEIRFTATEATGTCFPNNGCNRITKIGANAFANLKVRKIDLRNNPVTHVDNMAFSNLAPELESILIEGDGSNGIPYSALAILDEHLKYLHLEHYGIRTIQAPTVLPFPNLVSLTLKNWPHLEYMDADNFHILRNLEAIRLMKLPALTSVPVPVIRRFGKLTTFEIMETSIGSIIAETFTPLSMLKELKIHGNRHLTHVDKRAFDGVTDTVIYMDINNNNLVNIEFLIKKNWTVLNHLDISYNSALGTLPGGIFSGASSLYHLNCQGIGLTNIDQSMFSGLSNIHTVDLAYNRIATVKTGAFHNLNTLVELYMNGQSIQKPVLFQANAFNGIESSLETVSFSNNRYNLTQLWSEIGRFKDLVVVDLENIGAGNVPNKVFENNTKLERIVLSDNNITSLTQETFYGPRNTLQTIDLHGNNIRYINQCTLSDFSVKPTMILHGNPLVCNCDLVWLYDWIKTQSNRDFLTLSIGQCRSPKHLSGFLFSEFIRADMCPGEARITTCADLYTTTTIRIKETTTTPFFQSTVPLPNFEVTVIFVTTNTVEVTWLISDKTHVTGLKLFLATDFGTGSIVVSYPKVEKSSYTFSALIPDSFYTVCMVLEITGTFREADPKCTQVRTFAITTEKPVKSTTIPTPPRGDTIVG